MQKKKIAVIFGGNSTEYEVSLQSAFSVFENINHDKYDIIPIGITRNGDWYHYKGRYENIANNTWSGDRDNLYPVTVSVSHSQKGIWEFDEDQYTAVHIDLVFPILHGKNGEDGTLQGMFELSGIPVIGCNTLASALCMDKDRAHKLVSLAGVKVPKSVTFKRSEKNTALKKIETELSYPLFVKPVRAGSSFGITKVTEQAEINTAIESALEHDTEVIVEETINGFENAYFPMIALAGSKEQTEVHDSVKGLAAMNKNCRYEIWDKAAHNIPPVFSKRFNELIIRMAEI